MYSTIDPSECSQQILWVDQLTTEDQCAGLAAWEGVKYWLPCQQRVDIAFSLQTNIAYLQVNFVCVPSTSNNTVVSNSLIWLILSSRLFSVN